MCWVVRLGWREPDGGILRRCCKEAGAQEIASYLKRPMLAGLKLPRGPSLDQVGPVRLPG